MIVREVIFPQKLEVLQKQNLRKVAAYARVSTDSSEQENSLEAQQEYFKEYIQLHRDWEFVDVYYDHGISGLLSRNRDGFNQMINDALNGKIDLIVTKSLSRFARNTVDTLVTIRKLKERGVEVYFQKENIYTLDSKGEFMLTLMSSMAQEESRSISENVKWGHRKRFADGRYNVPYSCFLGYDCGGTNTLIVNEKEAQIVRLIYYLFLTGYSHTAICRYLEEKKIKAPCGGSVWHESVINSILTNEKYQGDALLQKTFIADFLTKKRQINHGELPKYYVEKGHDPIVSDEVFSLVHKEQQYREALHPRHSGQGYLCSKIVCGCCGSFYGLNIAHSNDKYRNLFWRCNSFYDGNTHSPKVKDSMIQKSCQSSLLQLIKQYDHVQSSCADLLNSILPNHTPHKWNKIITDMLQEAENKDFYSENIWRAVIDRIEVSREQALRVYFIDGLSIEIDKEENKKQCKEKIKRQTEEEIEHAILALRIEGKSYRAIHANKGISMSKIKKVCQKYNLNEYSPPKLHEKVNIITPPNRTICKNCGKEFVQKTKGKPRKFCSDECRQSWWNLHPEAVNKKAYYTTICLNCGKTFTAYGNNRRKYCCHGCYIEHRYRGHNK